MLNISSKTKSHILVLIFGPHVPLWLPSIVTLHISKYKAIMPRLSAMIMYMHEFPIILGRASHFKLAGEL